VLTVKTDKGGLFWTIQNEQILLWSETGYRFVKRQSQSDPNVWVALGERTRPVPLLRPIDHMYFGASRARSCLTPPVPDLARTRPALLRSRPHFFISAARAGS